MISLAALALCCVACGGGNKAATEQKADEADSQTGQATVYFTKDISPESLVKIYKSLGRMATGNVAVKISTGEAGNPNYLQPSLIKNLIDEVHGTIVECNTAYEGKRTTVEEHMKVIKEHGFLDIAKVDIMDAEGEFKIPVKDTSHIKYDIVGSHLKNYDFMINLAHFKGHAMGGFGGVMKNASIGVASTNGKAYIHSAGKTTDPKLTWTPEYIAAGPTQDLFLESMAAAAQAVHNYFNGHVIYINVMNNMSVDCDCDGHPAKPELLDMGIMASLDPVAVDQACLDKVFNYQGKPGDDNKPLIERINRQHGTYITDYAEKIGFGSKKYELIDLDK